MNSGMINADIVSSSHHIFHMCCLFVTLNSLVAVFLSSDHLSNAVLLRRAQYFWSQTDCAVSLQTPNTTMMGDQRDYFSVFENMYRI